MDVFLRIPWNWKDPRGAGQYEGLAGVLGNGLVRTKRAATSVAGSFSCGWRAPWPSRCQLTGKSGAIHVPVMPGFCVWLIELLYLTGNNPTDEERTEAGRANVGALDGSPVSPRARANFCWDASHLTKWLTAQLRFVYDNERAIPRVWAWKAADWREGVKKSWDAVTSMPVPTPLPARLLGRPSSSGRPRPPGKTQQSGSKT